MIEGREHLRLAAEARHTVGISDERGGQNFQRYIPPEPGVSGAIDLAHATSAERPADLVRPETSAGGKRHFRLSLAQRRQERKVRRIQASGARSQNFEASGFRSVTPGS